MDTEKRNLLIHTAETLIKTHDADLRETLVELAFRVEREALEEAARVAESRRVCLTLGDKIRNGTLDHLADELRRIAGEVK